MRLIGSALFLALSLVIADGCDSARELNAAARHGGTIFRLPGNQGFVEIKIDGGTKRERGAPGKGATNSILAYFYQPDGSTEMKPAPADVSVKLGPETDSPVATLSPQADSSFASEHGHHPSGFRGQLNARINGERVEVPILIR